jgi:hypothetical protein
VHAENSDSDCGLLLSAQLTLAAGHRYFVALSGDFSEVTWTTQPTSVLVGEGERLTCSTAKPWEVGYMGCQEQTHRTLAYTYRIDLLDEPLSRSEELALARRLGLAYDAVYVYDAALVDRAFRDRDCPFEAPLRR